MKLIERIEVDSLLAAPPVREQVLADGEAAIALTRALDAAEARTCLAYAEFAASGHWALDRARSPVAWLAARTGADRRLVHRRLRLGRRLADMPLVRDAWLAGEISAQHVAVLVRAHTARSAGAFARDEHQLVSWARAPRFDLFCRSVAYWAAHADPDGAERRDQEGRDARSLHLSESFGGTWFGEITGDVVGGSIVAGEVGRIEADLFAEDWAKAGAALGRDPVVSELGRTPAQRRFDALVAMAIRSRTAPEGGQRPRPLVTVLVGWESLRGAICQLEAGTVIAPGTLLSLLAEADIERVVFDPAGRPIDVGRRARLFTGATRRAIEVRDQECFHWSCAVPAPACQGDHHPVPYARGGETTVANGRMACGFHNRSWQGDPERGPPEPDS